MIVDVHAHLELEDFDKDRAEVIQRAKNVDVKAIICNGMNPIYNRKILELAKKYDLIKPALGYYPCECETVSKEDFKKELVFIKKSKPFAIGEIGLDKKYDKNFERQQECFRALIKIAQDLKVPIIVHSRQAEEKTIEIMEEMKVKKAIMHSFTGKKKLVERCVKNGWSISIPCTVIRSTQFQENVKLVPLRQLLTETDSPLQTHDLSIQRNEPVYIQESLKKIAEIKGLEIEELKKIIFSNYQRLF